MHETGLLASNGARLLRSGHTCSGVELWRPPLVGSACGLFSDFPGNSLADRENTTGLIENFPTYHEYLHRVQLDNIAILVLY